jgi:radical SAM superfamily enzyme YgiQ (UPF0313 family)
MPTAFLERAGFHVETMDVSVQEFDSEKVRRAGFIGISVPMHTALRLGIRLAAEIREINPAAHICFYGLYASLNADYLLATAADSVIGGEFEEKLVDVVRAVDQGADIDLPGKSTGSKSSPAVLERLDFPAPSRTSLEPLDRYAKLEYNGEQILAGYVEASRGCLHNCTHCPIPPVYGGRFFAMPKDVVLEDIRDLVASGARHITFGDPDFLNGPTHSLRIVRAMHEEFPDITFDFTAKIEHILKHRVMFPELARNGCIFVVSAVESLSDTVLEHLEKGHTRVDVFDAVSLVRASGIALRPTFVPFTPWATVDDYADLIASVEALDLIDHVDTVQYTIRLLVPPGSLLLSRSDTRRWLGPLNEQLFTYEWAHLDPRLDELHQKVSALVEQAVSTNEDGALTFYRIRELADEARGDGDPRRRIPEIEPSRFRPPRLTESWFCCAEPTRDQFRPIEKTPVVYRISRG